MGVLMWGIVFPKFTAPPSGENVPRTPKRFRGERTCSRSYITMPSLMGLGFHPPPGWPKALSFWTFALCYRAVVCLSVCLSVLSVCLPVCPLCNVGVLWPNGWTDPDETWHAGKPWPWSHCVSWGPRSPFPKGAQPPIFGPYLLWLNGSMDQDATW